MICVGERKGPEGGRGRGEGGERGGGGGRERGRRGREGPEGGRGRGELPAWVIKGTTPVHPQQGTHLGVGLGYGLLCEGDLLGIISLFVPHLCMHSVHE